MPPEECQRRRDQACRQALARDQRPAAGGAAREALPQRRPEQPRRARLRWRVEHRRGERRPEAAPQRIVRGQALRDGLPLIGSRQPPGGQIGAKARPRHPTRAQQDPERQRPAVGSHHPALASRQIDKRKARRTRPDQAVRGTDGGEIGERATVAAHQQVIAVVDHPPERTVEERTAASTGLIGGFVQRDAPALAHEPYGGSQSREPGPDHMDDRHRAQSSP